MSSGERAGDGLSGHSVLARLLLAVIGAGLLTGLIGGWLMASSAGDALRSEIGTQNEALAHNLANRLDDRIQTRINALRTHATRRGIEQFGPSTQNELNVIVRTTPEVDRLSVYRPDGTPVASASARGVSEPDELPPRRDLAERLGSRSHLAVLTSGRVPVVELTVPIERPPGTVVGMLVAELAVEELARSLTNLQFEPSRSAFLVDDRGTIVAHPQRDRVVNRQVFALPDGRSDALPGGGSYREEGDGEPHLFAWAPTDLFSAAVVVQQPEAAALRSVQDEIRDLIVILFAVVAVSVLVVALVGRHLLAPLGPMTRAAQSIAAGDHGARVPAGGFGEIRRLGEEFNRMAKALQQRIAELRDRKAKEVVLKERSQVAETLNRVGAALSAELDLQHLVQAVTDVATDLVGAKYGAFFYNVEDEDGGLYQLFALAGAERSDFEGFGMPRNTEIFGPTFRGEASVRHDDVTRAPGYGKNPPHWGMPDGHLPVRSYLAAPVVARSGEVIGGLFFGHPDPGVFTERDERLLTGIASQAAVAVDNARMYEAQRSTAEVLQRSLLPDRLPEIPGGSAAATYVPAQPRLDVGGDWYDVIRLGGGRVGLVVGDVVGRGLSAAATMGQVRHGLRAYVAEGYSPAEVLHRLNVLTHTITAAEHFVTVFYAVYDPDDATLRMASAGHPPVLLLRADGPAEYLKVPAGLPVGATSEETYDERVFDLPRRFSLLLYTDGLVEDRDMPISEGMERLRACAQVAGNAQALCDHVVEQMSRGRAAEDDMAVLAIRIGE